MKKLTLERRFFKVVDGLSEFDWVRQELGLQEDFDNEEITLTVEGVV